jgi:hypothetical protein
MREYRQPSNPTFVGRGAATHSAGIEPPAWGEGAYVCARWHTPGLDGREARYGHGIGTADGTAGAPKTA